MSARGDEKEKGSARGAVSLPSDGGTTTMSARGDEKEKESARGGIVFRQMVVQPICVCDEKLQCCLVCRQMVQPICVCFIYLYV